LELVCRVQKDLDRFTVADDLLLGPARRSPNFRSAIDDDIDSGDVRTVIGGQEQSDVRHFLGPAETSEQRLARASRSPIRVLELFSRLIGFN
jgi:hypothetical protein